MKFGSLCSGIEAASAAWNPLGWKAEFFSEIEPFPCSLLAHHYPETPNHGDMTKYQEWPNHANLDVLIGGTPCQSFSIAGLRKGLEDARGNLMLTYGEIAAQLRPRWLLWENVPGVLSSNGGKDFAVFLGLITGRKIHPPVDPDGGGRGWGNAGVIEGVGSAYGVAWRVLDAQYFGVAQRRRRVFVVGYSGDWRRAAAVLFERDSLSGNPPPSRKAGQRLTPSFAPSTAAGRGAVDPREAFDGPAGTLNANGKAAGSATQQDAESGLLVQSPRQPAPFCVSTGQAGAEIERDMAPTLNCNHEAPYIAGALCKDSFSGGAGGRPDGAAAGHFIAHTLRGEGFDASEDGSGRGTPIVAVEVGMTLTSGGTGARGTLDPVNTDLVMNAAPAAEVYPIDLRNAGRDPEKHDEQNRQGMGLGDAGDPSGTVTSAFIPGVAIGIGVDGGDVGFALRANPSHSGDKGDGGVNTTLAVAFSGRERGPEEKVNRLARPPHSMEEKTGALDATKPWNVAAASQVRRLTPRECERLQGFPDDYTLVSHRGKPATDGPRYKALGNSMAVPVIRWIGERMEAVDKISSEVA